MNTHHQRPDRQKSCPVCGGQTNFAFSHQVLGLYDAKFAICKSCEFVHAKEATWLAEAYSFALADTDTGAVQRNSSITDFLTTFAWVSGLSRARGLDIGGGHGLLVRMLRDRGLDFRWSDKHAQNLFARGFEDDGGRYKWLTLVEVFEHLTNPFEFFGTLIEKHEPDCVFFTTELKSVPIPPLDWWYWSFETGQHIGFASKRSLEVLANRLRYSLTSTGSFHLLHRNGFHKLAFIAASTRFRRYLYSLATWKLHSLTMDDHRRLVSAIRDRYRADR